MPKANEFVESFVSLHAKIKQKMRKTILTLLLTALTIGATAQSKDSTHVKNDSTVSMSTNQTDPVFPGGKEALKKFLDKNLHYPELAEQYGVEGSVVMTFIVDKDGALKDIAAKDCKIDRFNTTKFGQETVAKQTELKKEFALLFAKEGARVIRKMPKWMPGKLDGQAVNVKYNFPIHFLIPNK